MENEVSGLCDTYLLEFPKVLSSDHYCSLVNDLRSHLKLCNILMYADDTVIFYS